MKGFKLSKLAGMWCADAQFIAFLNRFVDGDDSQSVRYGKRAGDLDPAEFVRKRCQVQSRRELDTNPIAAKLFHREIRLPYSEWLGQQDQRKAA